MQADQIKELAGDKVFHKAASLLKHGSVRHLTVRELSDKVQADAQVVGTRIYQSMVVVSQEGLLSSSCNCPAAEYQVLCKHAAAVGLAYLDALSSSDDMTRLVADSDVDSPAAKPTLKERQLADISAWLSQQPQEVLFEQLFTLVVEQPDLREQLALKAALAMNPSTPSSLNKLITKALPKRAGLFEYRKVAQYFERASAQLLPVIKHVEQLSAEDALKWANNALNRLETVLLQIDDSDGARFGVEDALCHLIVSQFHRLDWLTERKMRWLLELQLNGGDLRPSADSFLLSEEDSRLFYQLVRAEFEEIEVAADYRQRAENPKLNTLFYLLSSPNAPQLTPEEQLKLREKTAFSFTDCLLLAENWLKLGDELKAEDFLIRARTLPAERWMLEKLNLLQQSVDLAQGKSTEVWQQCWQSFKEKPSFKSWQVLQKMAIQYQLHELPTDWLDEAEESLQKAMLATPNTKIYWHRETDEMVKFYLATGQLNKAFQWVEQYPVSAECLFTLALSDEVYRLSAPQACLFAEKSLASIVDRGNNQAYLVALGHLHQLEHGWGEQGRGDIQQLIRTLAVRFKRKTNFKRWLDEQFGRYLV